MYLEKKYFKIIPSLSRAQNSEVPAIWEQEFGLVREIALVQF